MEFPTARRKLNTYGKGNRKVLVHDIFGLSTQSLQSTPALSASGSREQPPEPSQHDAVPQSETQGAMNRTTSDTSTGRPGGQRTTLASKSVSAVPSPRKTSPSSLFEIESSDDDSSGLRAKRPLKKRKVVSPQREPSAGVEVNRLGRGLLSKSQSGSVKPETTVPRKQGVGEEMGKGSFRPLDPPVLKTDSRPKKQIPKMKPASTQPVERQAKRLGARPTSPDVLSLARKTTNKVLHIGSDSSAHQSDDSNVLASSRHSTPKRRRLAPDGGAVDSPSPSELHMTALRLTSDTIGQELNLSSDDEEMTDESQTSRPPLRGRRRLVDRLDAPASRNMGRMHSRGRLHTGETSKQTSSQPVSGTASPGRAGAAPLLVRADTAPLSVSSAAPSGRSRATYAKQRSYLSDMVDSLETQQGSLSQSSSQQDYFPQLSLAPSGSQMDLVHEDSDDDDFTQIKSIHELRRGGAIRKFDLDLHTIVEDIEADSKSLRIQALIQLNKKLQDGSFCRHFQDSGTFARFLECVKEGVDDVSATLMASVFQKMSAGESSSPKSCLQMLSALDRLPLHLLSDTRSLSRIAKDRGQNLSKLLIRDVKDFDEHVEQEDERTGRPVNTVFIGALDGILQSLIRLKEPLPQLPHSLLDAIVCALVRTEKDMQGQEGAHGPVKTIQQLLSILEIACANHELLGSSLSSSRVSELGASIAGVLGRARHAQPLTEQSCLRLIVTLSNNEPRVCDALTEKRLMTTVFQVIEDHFSTLADLAAREEDFDTTQLDSVILAVGCLLNLAECADAAREQMLEPDHGGKSLADRLVGMFNNHVDQASEAMTMQQTHVLVAFGYISALLCTLCLNAQARKQISESIKGEGLAELFGQADTFLNHLQTVEAALGDEGGSASGFTARFTAVLESVKQETRNV
ncbi:hypothetical protein A1O1_08403 [Capronia coronata CBS 617.96]|uniref:Wings apart-like protein C-terminal domain-containing protein n=1 Tax=Capronia coronata CBS 617.96 TaxID=1182541 RepID=W9XTE2_9EURO|nr:uncharacterized protein A1O1_08403 [Capronia coronata CBS 617.96]EXJ80261.1 hypothetical protein A1O1_08403 [Capronia coronata CBS 617.96]